MHPHKSRHKTFHSRNIHFSPAAESAAGESANAEHKCRVWLEGRVRSIPCSDRVFSSRHACLENARHVPPARCGSRRGPVSQVEFVDFFGDRPPVDDLRQPRHLRSCHHILQSTTRPRPKNGLESTMCCTLLRTTSDHHEYEHQLFTNVSIGQLHWNDLFQNFAQTHRLLPRGLMGSWTRQSTFSHE